MTVPLVLGHRGALAKAPENTLPSLRHAMAEGADGFEFDVVVELEGDSLFITAPDYSNPAENITSELECLNGSTFRFRPDPSSWWDVTFIEGAGRSAPIRWLRNSRFVGQRQLENRPGPSRARR